MNVQFLFENVPILDFSVFRKYLDENLPKWKKRSRSADNIKYLDRIIRNMKFLEGEVPGYHPRGFICREREKAGLFDVVEWFIIAGIASSDENRRWCAMYCFQVYENGTLDLFHIAEGAARYAHPDDREELLRMSRKVSSALKAASRQCRSLYSVYEFFLKLEKDKDF